MDGIYNYPKTQLPETKQADESQKESAISPFLQTITIELIIILVGFNIIVVILNYFNIIPVSQKFPKYFAFLPHQPPISTTQPKLRELTATPTPTGNPKLVELPIALGKPQIKDASLTYILVGYIGEITEVENGFRFSFKDRSIPSFLIGPKTEVAKQTGATTTPIKIGDLKVNDQVRVNATYNLLKKTWNTNRVILLPQQT